jgi:hypothetical protein
LIGLEEELRGIATDDGKERVAIRLLESGFEAELVSIEGDGLLYVADDKEG